MALEHFELPRDDWYDSDGRIYKDVLVENFNAIEAQINGLQRLESFDVEEVDWSQVEIADTTLASADNAVVNLRSLASIMQFNNNLPVQVTVSGKTIKRMEYYTATGRHVITDRELDIDEGQLVWFKPSDGSTEVCTGAEIEAHINNSDTGMLLGGFTNGQLLLSVVPRFIDYEIMTALSKIKTTGHEFPSQGKYWHDLDRYAGRRLGSVYVQRHAGHTHRIVLPDVGNKVDGARQ